MSRGSLDASPLFVGRVRELERLREAYAAASAGRGRCVLLAGEAGIGKTTTAGFWADRLPAGGGRAVWARCDDVEGAPPLWPWTQALRGCCSRLDANTLERLAGADASDLAVVVPEWRRGIAQHTPSTALATASARFRVFDSVARFLRALAGREPLALILDDLHAADATSLLLLRFLARQLREMAILVVATYRDGRQPDQLRDAVAELSRLPGTERIHLDALDPPEVAAYVERRAGARASAPVVAALHGRTGGNPLFVVEYVGLLLGRGLLSSNDEVPDLTSLPETLRATLEQRARRQSAACQRLLETAAAIGPEFPLDVARDAFARCPGSGDADDRFAPAYEEACDADLVVEAPEESRARFAHPLIREVLYEGLSASRRADVHWAIARSMEECARAEERLAEIAFHFSRAGGDEADAKAMHYARAAATQATHLTAYGEAARLYRFAAELAARSAVQDRALQCELLLDAGDADRLGAERAAAREAFQAAAAAARRLAASNPLEAAELLARSAIGLSGGWAGAGDVAQFDSSHATSFDAETVNLLQEALVALGDRDTAARARVLSQMAVSSHFTASRPERAARSRAAVELARRLDDPATLGHVLTIDWVVRWTPANTAERAAAADEIIACAERAADPTLAIGGRFQRIAALFELGEADALERESAEARRLAAALRQPQWMWRSRAHDVAIALLKGCYEEASQLLEQAREDPHDDSTARLFLALQTTALQRELGQADGLEASASFLRAIVDQYPMLPSLRTALARLYVDLEHFEAARAELEHVSARDFTDFPFDLTWIIALAEASEVCAALGDRARAAMLYDLLLPYAERHVVFLGGAVSWGSVARILGRLATVQERWEEAGAHFDAALAANRRLGARAWIAQTHYAYGIMLARRGDAAKARYFLDQARFAAESLGMRPLARQADAALGSAGASAAAGAPISPRRDARAALFRRDGDFWTIDFDGRLLRMRDLKGLHFLQLLLRHPGRDFHVLELVQLTGAAEEPGAAAALRAGGSASGDVVLDARAKSEYRRRVAELRSELEEAESWNDAGRAEQARAEIEALTNQLAAAVAPGGRDRRMGSAAERARTTVTKSIRTAIAKLAKDHPPLAEHLKSRIRTGYFCSYVADAERGVRWES